MTKDEARQYGREQRKRLNPDERMKKSRGIMTRVCGLAQFESEKNIYTYVSCNQEVDTVEWIQYCLTAGKHVFVPKIYGRDMKFHRIDSLSVLEKGSYGIMEPQNPYRSEWDTVSGMMLMPGLAFDRALNRAGYGGGFYDRFLCAHGGLFTVAVCFACQIVDRMQTQEFDVKPDVLICECGIVMQKGYGLGSSGQESCKQESRGQENQ